MATPDVRVNVEYDVYLRVHQDQDGQWVGFMEPFGITLRADSQEEIMQRANRAGDFFMEALEEYPNPAAVASAYFTRHSIPHVVKVQGQPEIRRNPDAHKGELVETKGELIYA